MKTWIYALTAVFCLQLPAAQFKYNELMIKDYDEMLQMVNTKLKQSRASGEDQEAIEHMREGTKLILSRPDSDNMVAELMPELRKELIGYNAFEDTLSGLAAEAIAIAKDDKAATSVQATALVILENLLAQIRPEISENAALRRIVERIQAADIEVSSGVRKALKLRGMFVPKNPSELAKDILKKAPPPKEVKKKAKPEEE